MSLFGACWPRKWLTEAVCASIYLSWFMSKTPFFRSLSCPGVVSEQKSSHPEVQRSQEGAVAGWQPGPRWLTSTSHYSQQGHTGWPSTCLPHPGEGGDWGSLLLCTMPPSLLHRRGECTLWLHFWATRRQLQPTLEGTVVPIRWQNLTCGTSVVPVSLRDEELQRKLPPGSPHVLGISRAANAHVPRLNSRHPWLWFLGCLYGEQPTTGGSVPASWGFLDWDVSRGLQGVQTSSASPACPPATAVPAGDPKWAGWGMAGGRGVGEPS